MALSRYLSVMCLGCGLCAVLYLVLVSLGKGPHLFSGPGKVAPGADQFLISGRNEGNLLNALLEPGRPLARTGDGSEEVHVRVRRATAGTVYSLTAAQQARAVDLHNAARVGVTPTASNMNKVAWSNDLKTITDAQAALCLLTNPNRTLEQSVFTAVGENIHFLQYFVSVEQSLVDALASWMGQMGKYNITTNTCDAVNACGKYIQVVWALTTYLACTVVKCNPTSLSIFDNAAIVICNYGEGANITTLQVPYKSGSACEECEPDISCCVDGLCIACPNGAKVYRLTAAQQALVLDGHNTRRGAVSPAASDMNLLEWDTGLKKVTDAFAELCSIQGNPNRTLDQSTFGEVGENLYMVQYYVSLNRSLTDAVSSFDAQKTKYTFGTNTCQATNACSSYLQLIWAPSTALACTVVRCNPFGPAFPAFSNGALVICNYGEGANITTLQQPYTAGDSCSSCSVARPCCETNLCKPGVCPTTIVTPTPTMTTSATATATLSTSVATTTLISTSVAATTSSISITATTSLSTSVAATTTLSTSVAPTTTVSTSIAPTTLSTSVTVTTTVSNSVAATTTLSTSVAPTTALSTSMTPTTTLSTSVAATTTFSTSITPTTTVSTSVAPTTTLSTSVAPTTTVSTSLASTSTLSTSVPPTTTLSTSVPPTTTLSTSVTPTTTTLSTSVPLTTILSTSVAPKITPSTSLAPPTALSTSVPPTPTLSTSVTPTATLSTSVPPTTTLSISVAPTITPSTSLAPTTTLSTSLAPTSTSVVPTTLPSTSVTSTLTPLTSVTPTMTPPSSITVTPSVATTTPVTPTISPTSSMVTPTAATSIPPTTVLPTAAPVPPTAVPPVAITWIAIAATFAVVAMAMAIILVLKAWFTAMVATKSAAALAASSGAHSTAFASKAPILRFHPGAGGYSSPGYALGVQQVKMPVYGNGVQEQGMSAYGNFPQQQGMRGFRG